MEIQGLNFDAKYYNDFIQWEVYEDTSPPVLKHVTTEVNQKSINNAKAAF